MMPMPTAVVRSLAALSIAAMLSAAPSALAQDAVPANIPAIVTSGEATVRQAPDVAFVMVAVESRAKSPRDAQRQNADAMAKVVQRLAGAGIPRASIRTIGLSLNQEFDNVEGRQVSRGYQARNTLEAKVSDVATVGEIADAAIQAGATTLDGVRFDLADRGAAEREALRLAVADARARAEAAAAGVGRSVDRVLRIEDQRVEAIGPRPMPFARAAAQASTPVEPGLIEIQARATLTVSMR